MKRSTLQYGCISIFLLVTSIIGSQTGRGGFILGEFWTETEPLVNGLPGPPPDVTQLSLTILTEAQRFFSGVIYGYQYRYVPYDATRKIDEQFELEPLGLLPFGAPGLRYVESRKQDNQAFMRLLYEPKGMEITWWNRWRSAALPSSVGIGTSPVFSEENPRLRAFELACKEAVREHGRILTRNKPMEMTGTLALAEIPAISIRSGNFYVRVRALIHVEDMYAYRTW